MSGFFNVPEPKNEPVLSYAPGTKERDELQNTYQSMKNQTMEIPMNIGGQKIFTDDKKPVVSPHNHHHVLANHAYGDIGHVEQAVTAAMNAKYEWENTSWEHRASIFLKVADLLSGPYRARMNAATMLGQSKSAFQAEIDAACELADFLRFNVKYMTQIYQDQPTSSKDIWNRMEYRPLEGFIYAVTPFNFTAISGNLPSAPALMGNTVIWKPSRNQVYSAMVLMELFEAGGVPPGVINLIFGDAGAASDYLIGHKDFGGVHFTGSTNVFQGIWKKIGENIQHYKSYPRIVGETGGKDFVIAHESSDIDALVTGLIRGAFEYQGQKCSAASRAYIPDSIWPEVKDKLKAMAERIKMGDPGDFSNFMNAVIDERAFDKITTYIENAKNDPSVSILHGGNADKSEGYFIEPTILVTENPTYVTMVEEIFGPVLTIYIYRHNHFQEALELVDGTSPYSLTGAVFAQDRYVIEKASRVLKNASGNFYINDKPTGAVVGQQPFGGARASGTNDKAGSMMNLLRWVSARSIKENFVPPHDFVYPFMG